MELSEIWIASQHATGTRWSDVGYLVIRGRGGFNCASGSVAARSPILIQFSWCGRVRGAAGVSPFSTDEMVRHAGIPSAPPPLFRRLGESAPPSRQAPQRGFHAPPAPARVPSNKQPKCQAALLLTLFVATPLNSTKFHHAARRENPPESDGSIGDNDQAISTPDQKSPISCWPRHPEPEAGHFVDRLVAFCRLYKAAICLSHGEDPDRAVGCLRGLMRLSRVVTPVSSVLLEPHFAQSSTRLPSKLCTQAPSRPPSSRQVPRSHEGSKGPWHGHSPPGDNLNSFPAPPKSARGVPTPDTPLHPTASSTSPRVPII